MMVLAHTWIVAAVVVGYWVGSVGKAAILVVVAAAVVLVHVVVADTRKLAAGDAAVVSRPPAVETAVGDCSKLAVLGRFAALMTAHLQSSNQWQLLHFRI